MERALAELGDPHRRYRTLHVGGTNGKGSVASTWASVLGRSGQRTGLYTSPHLCSFGERIVVDGAPIQTDALLRHAKAVGPLVDALGLSFFEAATLLAFHVFAEEGVAVAAIEVGLGGRLDATNVVDPQVTAITNVALDHQEYLGGTLMDIAGEKAGIIKTGVPTVSAEGRPGVLDVFRRRAAEVGAPFHRIDPWRDITELQLGNDGTRFRIHTETWGPLTLETPLLGAHQATNAALAVRALEFTDPIPSKEDVLEGVANVRWPGRVQVRRRGDTFWIFDVAHNTAGVRALSRVLADLSPPRPLVVLVGILGDKDWPRMLPPLVDLADRVVFTNPASAPAGRSRDPATVAATVQDGTPIEVEPDIGRAVDRVGVLAEGGTAVVAGSCYTVGDSLQILGFTPYAVS